MAKFAIQAGRYNRDWAYVHVEKPEGDKFLEIRDSRQNVIGKIHCDRNHKIFFDFNDPSQTQADYEVVGLSATTALVDDRKPTKELQEGPGWKRIEMDDGSTVVRFSNKRGNRFIDLDYYDGDLSSPPGDVYALHGQANMLYSLAHAFKMNKASLLIGPTGIGKTTAYELMASLLNYNFVVMEITRGTESIDMVGDFLPDGNGNFIWQDGPVTQAMRISHEAPTILIFDELNRIQNTSEYSRLYRALQSGKLWMPQKNELVERGRLFIGATSNPSDDPNADYIGVQDLDPALRNRFSIQPKLGYPEVKDEVAALVERVPGTDSRIALQMVNAANRIREAPNVRFPMSFRELIDWAEALPYFDMGDAAEETVVNKAPANVQQDIRNLLQLQDIAQGAGKAPWDR